MMELQNTIHKTLINFRYPNRNLAVHCSSLIEKIFESHLIPEIDQAIKSKAINEFNFELDSIEIDIGTIKESELERYLGERIKEALVLKLSTSLSKRYPFLKMDERKGISIFGEGLHFFLTKGFMPDWIEFGMGLDRLMELIIATDPTYFSLLIKKIARNRDAKKRWVFGISNDSFDNVIQILEPSNKNWIIEFRIALSPSILEESPINVSKDSLNKSFNYFILEFITDQSGSEFNRLSFSKSILKQTAAHYNVDFNSLVNLLVRTLKSPTYQKPIFKKLQDILVKIRDGENPKSYSKPIIKVDWTYIFNTLSWDEIIRKYGEKSLEDAFDDFTSFDHFKINNLNKEGLFNLIQLIEKENSREILTIFDEFFNSYQMSSTKFEREKILKSILISWIELKKQEPFESNSKLLFRALLEGNLNLENNDDSYLIKKLVLEEKYNKSISNLHEANILKKSIPQFRDIDEEEFGLVIKGRLIKFYLQNGKLPNSFRKISIFEMKHFFLDLLGQENSALKEIFHNPRSQNQLLFSLKYLLDKKNFPIFLTFLNEKFDGFAGAFQLFPSNEKFRLIEFQNELISALIYSKGEIESSYFTYFKSKAHWKSIIEEKKDGVKPSQGFFEIGEEYFNFSERLISYDEKSRESLEEIFWYQKITNPILLTTNSALIKTLLKKPNNILSISIKKGTLIPKASRVLFESLKEKVSGIKELKQLEYLKSNKPRKISAGMVLETLLFWSEFGFLPWWSPFQKVEKLVNFLLEGNLNESDVEWTQIMSTLSERENFSRLILALDQNENDSTKYSLMDLVGFDKKDLIRPKSPRYSKVNDSKSKAKLDSSIDNWRILYSNDRKFLDEVVYKFEDGFIVQKLFRNNSKIQDQLMRLLKLSNYLYYGNLTGDKWRRMIFEFAIDFYKSPKSTHSDTFIYDFLNFIRRKYSIYNWKKIFSSAFAQLKKQKKEKLIPNIFLEKFDLKMEDSNESHQEEKIESGQKIKISNSGLVLTWPFLTMLFSRSGMIEGNKIKDEKSQNRAVYMLQYLVFNNMDFPEYELVLNKLLVGMPLSTHLEPGVALTEEEKNLCESLLKGMLQNWEKLKTSTIEALQMTFLNRGGELTVEDNQIVLEVETKGVDALMDSITWNIKMVKLPWMEKPIQIKWK